MIDARAKAETSRELLLDQLPQANQGIHVTSQYYSLAEEEAAKRIERNKLKDILEVLAENPRLQAENHNRHQEESTRALQESWRIEKQLAAEKAAGAKL